MKTILVADDDPVMVKLFEYNFARAGYRVVVCREGLCVREKTLESKPDLAILDVMLPGRTGLELIRDFKSDPALCNIPVVVVTSQGKGSTQEELLSAGAANVFTKPFSPTILIARIQQLLAGTA